MDGGTIGLGEMHFESPGARVGGWVPAPRDDVAHHAAGRRPDPVPGTREAGSAPYLEPADEPYLPPDPGPASQVTWLGSEPAAHGPTGGRWLDRALPGLRRRPRNVAAVVSVSIALALLLYLISGPMRRPTAAPRPAAPPPSAAAPAFVPITIEAEAPGNMLTGSALVAPFAGASGGQVVRALGNWGNAKGPGALRFTGVTVPASGMYALTFTYVNIKTETTRTVVITASAGGSMSVTVANNGTCCTGQLVQIFLFKGANSITFSNPTGHAPAIDTITIDRR